MGQVIRSPVSSLSICPPFHGRNFYPILTKFSTDVWNLKWKNPSIACQNSKSAAQIFAPFYPKISNAFSTGALKRFSEVGCWLLIAVHSSIDVITLWDNSVVANPWMSKEGKIPKPVITCTVQHIFIGKCMLGYVLQNISVTVATDHLYRKLYIGNRMVTWLMASRDPQRSRKWYGYVWGLNQFKIVSRCQMNTYRKPQTASWIVATHTAYIWGFVSRKHFKIAGWCQWLICRKSHAHNNHVNDNVKWPLDQDWDSIHLRLYISTTVNSIRSYELQQSERYRVPQKNVFLYMFLVN